MFYYFILRLFLLELPARSYDSRNSSRMWISIRWVEFRPIRSLNHRKLEIIIDLISSSINVYYFLQWSLTELSNFSSSLLIIALTSSISVCSAPCAFSESIMALIFLFFSRRRLFSPPKKSLLIIKFFIPLWIIQPINTMFFLY